LAWPPGGAVLAETASLILPHSYGIVVIATKARGGRAQIGEKVNACRFPAEAGGRVTKLRVTPAHSSDPDAVVVQGAARRGNYNQ
jgi:hypothetical protein